MKTLQQQRQRSYVCAAIRGFSYKFSDAQQWHKTLFGTIKFFVSLLYANFQRRVFSRLLSARAQQRCRRISIRKKKPLNLPCRALVPAKINSQLEAAGGFSSHLCDTRTARAPAITSMTKLNCVLMLLIYQHIIIYVYK
jgi:hypothetical protein